MEGVRDVGIMTLADARVEPSSALWRLAAIV